MKATYIYIKNIYLLTCSLQ